MNMQKIVDMLFPVLLAAVGWLLTEIASFNNRLLAVESKMPALITLIIVLSKLDLRVAVLEDKIKTLFDLINKRNEK